MKITVSLEHGVASAGHPSYPVSGVWRGGHGDHEPGQAPRITARAV